MNGVVGCLCAKYQEPVSLPRAAVSKECGRSMSCGRNGQLVWNRFGHTEVLWMLQGECRGRMRRLVIEGRRTEESNTRWKSSYLGQPTGAAPDDLKNFLVSEELVPGWDLGIAL